MTIQPKTSKISKKLLAAIIIVIVAVASASAAAVYVLSQKPASSSLTIPALSLTVTGANGETKTLTQTDFASMQQTSGKGGFETSNGLISETGTYKGVVVTSLLSLVGGIASGESLNVTASDGYSIILTYAQVNGEGFTTFDSTTGSQTSGTPTITLLLAYSVNGTNFASDEGPLRLVAVSSDGLLIQGHYSVKMVTGLQVISSGSTASPSPTASSSPTASASPTPTPSPSPATWSIIVNGSSAVTMSASTFASQVTQNTTTYNDGATTWGGTSLQQIVSWAENDGVMSSSALSLGYVIEVIGSDGYTKAFNDSRIVTNNLMVANTANGSPLTGSSAPLALEGAGLVTNEKVTAISQILILPIQDCSVTIIGAGGSQVTLYSNDLALMSSVTLYGGSYKSSVGVFNNGSYTGVTLLSLCNLVGGITSSNTVTVTGSDAYTVTYTYAEIASGTGFSTVDNNGNSATPTQPLYLILAYWLNGGNLPDGSNGVGPLKTEVVGADGLNTFGNIAAKYVVQITIS